MLTKQGNFGATLQSHHKGGGKQLKCLDNAFRSSVRATKTVPIADKMLQLGPTCP